MSMPQVHNAKMKLLLCQLLIMSPNLWHQQAQTHHNHLQFLSSSGNAKSIHSKSQKMAKLCQGGTLPAIGGAAAAVANGVLVDVGLVTEDDKTRIIDRSKHEEA